LSQQDIKSILERYHTVAVVGLSKDSSKPSHRVARYLQAAGYRVIPVNPFLETVLGEKAYSSILDVLEPIDIVDIFRPSDQVLPIIEQAINMRIKSGYPHVIWMQEGIANDKTAQHAKQAGLTVVMDRCIKKEHQRLNHD
jgi:predicted CoA-binding protein